VVRCLVIEAGANVNQADGHGRTPLWAAAEEGHEAVVWGSWQSRPAPTPTNSAGLRCGSQLGTGGRLFSCDLDWRRQHIPEHRMFDPTPEIVFTTPRLIEISSRPRWDGQPRARPMGCGPVRLGRARSPRRWPGWRWGTGRRPGT